MTVTFLGTGAADWTEEDWSEHPETSRFLTCALIDGHILIDCGPTLFASAERAGADLAGVDTVLVTHLHRDHYCYDSLLRLAATRPVTVYTSEVSAERIAPAPGLTVRGLPLYETLPLCGGEAMLLPANHYVSYHTPNLPVHYVLTLGGATLFWGCDGHRLICEAWSYLQRFRFDLMVLDGTFGETPALPYYFEHNNIFQVEEMARIFRSEGLLRGGGAIYMNHMSKNEHTDHATLSARMAGQGVGVTCDGLTLSVGVSR